jgi:hypothetical protein
MPVDEPIPAPVPPEPLPAVQAGPVPPEPLPPSGPPSYPPPTGQPVLLPSYSRPAVVPHYTPVAVAPPSRRRTALVVTAIVVASSAVLGALVVGIIAVASTFGETVTALGGAPISTEPPLTGEPGSPLAEQPSPCADPCFGADDVRYTIADKGEFTLLGLTETVAPWGTYDASTVQAEYSYSAASWEELEGTPDECFALFSWVPMAIPFGERPSVSADAIHFTGTRQDPEIYSSLESSVRVFADTASATAHMVALDSQIDDCTHYQTGTGAEYWSADVTKAPALDIPAKVAAVGWVEDAPLGRYYVFDVQRANLVVRTSLGTAGTITEPQFRVYLEHLAIKLALLEPSAG